MEMTISRTLFYIEMRLNDRDVWVELPIGYEAYEDAERSCKDLNRYEDFTKYRAICRTAK